jgi:hypothetical protein
LEKSDLVTEEFVKINKALFDKFAHFENDLEIDYKVRDYFIRRWYIECNQLGSLKTSRRS